MLRFTLVVLFCVLISSSCGTDYQPGTTPTVASVNQGAFEYEIPLELPRGINGLEPQLKFVYRNSLEWGKMGLSWDISGFSRIHKCHTVVEQTGVPNANAYCLNGVPLVPISSGSLEYRTIVDSYSRIVADSANPSTFTVQNKDLTVETFGRTGDAMMTGSSWLLRTVADRYNNMITFTYIQDGGFSYPNSISYGNVQVQFTYDRRLPWLHAYERGNSLVQTSWLLTNVTSFVNNNVLRRWILGYDNSTRSVSTPLLTSITICGYDWLCLTPITFQYQGTDYNVKYQSARLVTSEFGYNAGWDKINNPRTFVDMNNDGLADVVAFGENGVLVALYSLDKQAFLPSVQVSDAFGHAQGWDGKNNPRFVMDMNGDGLPDIVGFSQHNVLVSLNTINGAFLTQNFSEPQSWSSDFGSADGWSTQNYFRQVVDMNGDGLPDIVANDNQAWYVAVNTRTAFAAKRIWINGFGSLQSSNSILVTDVDLDGLPDVFYLAQSGSALLKNLGSSFQYIGYGGSDTPYQYRGITNGPCGRVALYSGIINPTLADINNDGLPDIVATFVYFDGCRTKTYYSNINFNTGNGFGSGPRVMASDLGSMSTSNEFYLGDTNADGLNDFIVFANDGLHVYTNMGNGFSVNYASILPELSNSMHDASRSVRAITDLTGDGIADIVVIGKDGIYLAQNMHQPVLMTVVRDPLGNTREVQYAPLTDAEVYGSGNKFSYPYADITTATSVVKTMRVDDGVGGKNLSTYFYSDRAINLRGLGFMSYSSIESRRPITDTDEVFSTLSYATVYPFVGLLTSSTMKINAATVSHNEFKYTFTQPWNIQLQLVSTTAEEYDLDGTMIKSATTSFSNYDAYGNVEVTVSEIMNLLSTYRNEKIVTFQPANVGSWMVGLIQVVNETRTDVISGKSYNFSTVYNANSFGKVISKIEEPDDLDNCLKTTYNFDPNGNPTYQTEAVCANAIQARQSAVATYIGTTVSQTSNMLGHTETYQYDNWARLVGITDANGVQKAWSYNGLGQLMGAKASGQADVTITYRWYKECDQCVYLMERTEQGKGTESVIYDSYQRERRSISQTDDRLTGASSVRDTTYNKAGLPIKKSLPYENNFSPIYWTLMEYDLKGRQTKLSHPVDSTSVAVVTTAYSGSRVTVTDALGKTISKTVDVGGNPIQSTDATNAVTNYKYDTNGKLVEIIDPAGHSIMFNYDKFGNRISSSDANMGYWTYEYNALGDLVKQTDPKGQILHLVYDPLGRLKNRSEPEGTTTWSYDTAINGVGKVAAVTSPFVTQMFTYSTYGQVIGENVTFPTGPTYSFQTAYDQNNRVAAQTLPGGYTYNFDYAGGLLAAVRQGTSYLWQAKRYDASLRLQDEQHGNGVSTSYEYNLAGQTLSIHSINEAGTQLRALTYNYDVAGKLTSHSDDVNKASETFKYDSLDRILTATVTSGSKTSTESWEYDTLGNIQSYTGSSGKNKYTNKYTYYSNRPHAVQMAGSHKYSYDDNGNVLQRDDNYFGWTSFNKITSMKMSDGQSASFQYDADRNKVHTAFSDGSTVVELGPMFRREMSSDGVQNDVHTIYALGKAVAIIRVTVDSSSTVQYPHVDQMGSLDLVTDLYGNELERYSYNAFGKARAENWQPALDPTACNPPNYLPGFTGQQFLDQLGLLDMKGRLYDPAIFRFLSPDPFIANILDAQTFNRYSYASNSPFKYRDPSGYFFFLLLPFLAGFGLLAAGAISLGVTGIVAGAISMTTKYVASMVFAEMFQALGIAGSALSLLTSVFSGAMASFMGSVVTTEGNLGLSGRAALSGAVMGIVEGISGKYTFENEINRIHYSRSSDFPSWLKVAAESAAGGVGSIIMTGKFMDGFTLSLKTSAFNEMYNLFVKYDFDFGPGGAARAKENALTQPWEFGNNVGESTRNPGQGFLVEGGPLSNALNRIPTVNAIAGAHDMLLVVLGKVFGGDNLANVKNIKEIFNVVTMPTAIIFSELAGANGAVTVPFIAKGIAEQESYHAAVPQAKGPSLVVYHGQSYVSKSFGESYVSKTCTASGESLHAPRMPYTAKIVIAITILLEFLFRKYYFSDLKTLD